MLISNAHGGLSKASAKAPLDTNGLSPKSGEVDIAPGLKHSLRGVSAYADEGCYVVFHPHEEGVTIHRREDLDLTCKRGPVETGWRANDGARLWHVPIAAKNKSTLVERLLLTKSPRVTREQLPDTAVEHANNVYELPAIAQAIA